MKDERVIIRDEKRYVRLVSEDIEPHIHFFRLHYVRRIAQDNVKLSKIRRIIENIGLYKVGTACLNAFELRCEILSGGHVQGILGYIYTSHPTAGNRKSQRPGDAARAGTQVQNPDRPGILSERKSHPRQTGCLTDSLRAKELGLRTWNQD